MILGIINYIEENPQNFCGIYCLYCLSSNKFYIGSSEVFHRRKNNHLLKLNKSIHENIHLQAAWNKYGSDNFKWLKLQNVDNKDVLINEEQKYLDLYQAYNNKIGYNISEIAGKPKSLKGLKRPKEFGDNVRRFKTGSKHTDETKAIQRARKTGIPLSESHRNNISESHKKNGFKPCQKALELVIKANSKEYIFLSPDNKIIKVINLMKFCKENNLNRTYMSLIFHGKYGKNNCHKGWKSVNIIYRYE